MFALNRVESDSSSCPEAICLFLLSLVSSEEREVGAGPSCLSVNFFTGIRIGSTTRVALEYAAQGWRHGSVVRAPTVLPEVLSSGPGTHVVAHNGL